MTDASNEKMMQQTQLETAHDETKQQTKTTDAANEVEEVQNSANNISTNINDDNNEDENDEDTDADIYQNPLPNRVIIARNHPLQYYVDRARRILRMDEQLTVSGRGNTISMACTLVEILKRQQIAVVTSIKTEMSTQPIFTTNRGNPFWATPRPQICFELKRGKFAEYVADYHQRKVIEIFEKSDPKCSGFLSFAQVEELDLATAFKANDEQKQTAVEFRESCIHTNDDGDEDEDHQGMMNLPMFIGYCSSLIHPLLRDRVFKQILADKFGIITERAER